MIDRNCICHKHRPACDCDPIQLDPAAKHRRIILFWLFAVIAAAGMAALLVASTLDAPPKAAPIIRAKPILPLDAHGNLVFKLPLCFEIPSRNVFCI